MIVSKFNKKNTAENVTQNIDLSGMNVAITGINSGLGQETMRVLESRGAHIIGMARTLEKAKSSAKSNGGNITPLACELSNFESVKRCADSIKNLDLPIDVLICNAGIMALPELELQNGFEQQFNTNHLGHFVLAHNLQEQVKKAKQGRVVMLSSLAHKMAPLKGIDFDNLDGSQGYNNWKFYGQAKLANMLTAMSLAKQFEGSYATANAVHPGIIKTNLSRSMNGLQGLLINNPVSSLLIKLAMGGKSIPQGASTQCYVATAPELSGVSGKYFSDNNEDRPSRLAQNEDLADRLWGFSCDVLKEYL
jgi:WW domain-containing oxidoreductase